MHPSYITNLLADARHLPLGNGTVQCVVTSPPYFGLRDYRVDGQIGLERTPEDYVATLVDVFREVWRVLKDDGTLWLNLGDSYANKNLNGIPWRVAFALQAEGWYLRADIIWAKTSCVPENVTDRTTRSHEYLFLLTKTARYYYDADAISTPAITAGSIYPIGPKSFSKGQAFARNVKASGNGLATHETRGERCNRRSVWTISTEKNDHAHFATFPERLVDLCIKAGSRVGSLVLDPFSGSGTVGRVCARLGRSYVGCDINPDYFAIANRRQSEVQVEMFSHCG